MKITVFLYKKNEELHRNIKGWYRMSNEELVQLYQNGDKKALEKLIQSNTGIINKIANKYNGINIEL